jgi:hypothetical protein
MGTLTALVPLLGILIGAILPKLVPEEINKGKPYFQTLLHFMFSIMVALIAATYNKWYALIGAAIFALNFKLKINYPTYIIPLFAILVITYPILTIPTLIMFIPLGTIHHKQRTRLFIYGLAYIAIVITSIALSTKPI